MEETRGGISKNLHYNEVGQVVVHTDGGCTNPEYRRLRRPNYGISYGEGHKWNRAEALRGVEQTAGRAELRAALGAFEWAEESTEVISDNDRVVKGTYAITMGGGNSQGAHQDLWVRMRGPINRLGPGGSAIRWTKGHATQQHIDEGFSTLADQAGNDRADSLATEAQGTWKIEGTTEAYYFIRRRAAHLMQRMMVACAFARKRATTKAKEDEVIARLYGGETRGSPKGGSG